MAKSRKKSPTGLLSEAAKKAGRAIGQTARRVVGKKPPARAKSASGNLSEAAKKAWRGVKDSARKVVGKKPTKRPTRTKSSSR